MKTYCFFIVFWIAVTHVYVTYGDPIVNNTQTNRSIKVNYTLCASDECISAASQISANLNRKVDPCDNFHKFACGGWIQNHPVDELFSYVDSLFVELDMKTENQLQELLEEPIKKGDTLSFLKAKHVFGQCMDNESNTTIAVNNNTAIWNEYIGWLWNTTSRTWKEELLQELREWQSFSNDMLEHGFNNGIFDIDVTKDFTRHNSSTNVIVISQPSPFVPLRKTRQYKSVSLIKMFRVLSPYRGSLDNITHIASEIETFANKLDDLLQFSLNNDRYISLTIQEWQKRYDRELHSESNAKIDWHLTIQKAFEKQEITIEPSERLVITEHNYLLNLIPLLERTPSRVIINYMKWTLFHKLEHYKRRTETDSRDKMSKTCVKKLNFESAISHKYVKKYASHLDITAIRVISSDIKDVFADKIRQSTWMDEPTKHSILEELSYMKLDFIKPDWYSDEAIDKHYESLNVDMEYFANILTMYLFERKMMLRSLREPVDKTRWDMEPTEVAAYFNLNFNKIVVTAAVFQTPIYYNISRPLSIIYGSLGSIIAHEITHMFDIAGRESDDNNNDGYISQWMWTVKSSATFDNVTQCFVEQYNNYLVPGLDYLLSKSYVNGRATLEENICDSAGIVSAYYAYKNRKARLNETEWRIQGLEEYSDDQLFFMTFAQTLCSNHHPVALEHILRDFHAPNEIRVRGSLSNSREFSEVYNCPVGKPMNPEEKCTLWQ